MGSYIQSLNKFLKISILFALLITTISCSQNTPEIHNSDYSLIFDYDNENETPNARLSLFIESDSDVRRIDKLIVTSMETNLIWTVEDIQKLEKDNIQYAGNANLVVPEKEIIPTGTYKITCVNADEKETDIYFTVIYDTSFYELNDKDVEEKIRKNHGLNKIAIYDKDNIMLYLGNRTAEFNTKTDIWNYYRNADYYRDIWCTSDNRVICILPAQSVVSK